MRDIRRTVILEDFANKSPFCFSPVREDCDDATATPQDFIGVMEQIGIIREIVFQFSHEPNPQPMPLPFKIQKVRTLLAFEYLDSIVLKSSRC